MKRLVEDAFYITAKEAARALPKNSETGRVSLEIAGSYTQDVVVVSTASNLEGFVKWFVCPACKNRVGKLYLPTGEAVFLCRKCHDLAYRAQQLRAFKNQERTNTDTAKKPKGMAAYSLTLVSFCCTCPVSAQKPSTSHSMR